MKKTLIPALALLLAGCQAPPAPAVAPPGDAVFPPAPVAVQASPAPAAPDAAVTRLVGVAVLNDAPLAGATVKALDLATGRVLPLIGLDGSTLATGADGRFDLTIAKLRAGQVVKLVAAREGRTLVTLIDHQGRSLAADPAPPSSYRLAQVTGEVTLTVRLRLTAATSAAAKAFEGAFKLSFQLDGDDEAGGLAAAMKAAEDAVAAITDGLAADPTLGAKLAAALDGDGELADLPAYRAVVDALGKTADLGGQVRDVLQALVPLAKAGKDGLDPVTSEDFPIGKVEISYQGAFSFEDAKGGRITGAIEAGKFVPTETPVEPDRQPAEPASSKSDKPQPLGDAGGGLAVKDGTLIDPTEPEGLAP